MVPRLHNYQVIAIHQVHKAVLVGDSPGPNPGEHVFEGFGFGDAAERISLRIVKQTVEALENLSIDPDLVLVVLPAVRREDQPQSMSS